MKRHKPHTMFILALGAALGCVASASAQPANGKKPNILVIWGDDIGITNISHNSRGLMGYKTPGSFNLEKIQKQLEAGAGGK